MANMILVIGCNHGIQTPDIFDTGEAVQQRQHWRALVMNSIAQTKAEFIGEEWGLEAQTVARECAQQANVPWANINTSFDDLDAMRIPRDYVSSCRYSAQEKQEWNAQRERVMIQKVERNKGNAAQLIVICGFDHMEPMSSSMRTDTQSVEIIDYRLCNWYRPGIFQE